MFDRSVSKLLAQYLADVENGRLSVEECLRQHPEHAEELRHHLELHEHLVGLQRPSPSFLGEQRGRQMLLTAVASYNMEGVPRKMIPNLLSSAIAKAIAGTLAGAILLTGAVGASAAMGGPNLPSQALSALGLDGNHNDNGDSQSPTATATTTATSHVDVTTTPGPQEFVGLCNAWSQGSGNGQTNKRDATAFQDLIKAANAQNLTDQALENRVSQFCTGVTKPGDTPTQTGNKPTGTPGEAGNKPTGTPGQGNNGNSNGRPDGTPIPPVTH